MFSIGLYVSPYNFFVENWVFWVFYNTMLTLEIRFSSSRIAFVTCWRLQLPICIVTFPHYFGKVSVSCVWPVKLLFHCLFSQPLTWQISPNVWIQKKNCALLFKSFYRCCWRSCRSPRQSWNKGKYLLWPLRALPDQTKCTPQNFGGLSPYCSYWHSQPLRTQPQWG